MTDSRPLRILIVRLSAIGDTVLTVPLLNALRRNLPDAELSWVVNEPSGQLLRGHEALDHLVVIERNWLKSPRRIRDVRRRLRALRPDVAIDVQGLTKSAILAWISGAKRRIGATRGEFDGREISTWLNNNLVTLQRQHVIERNLELLRPLGIVDPPVEFRLPQRAEDEEMARRFLRQHDLGSRFATINPGAGWESKVWPCERYGELAHRLGRQLSLPSVVVWAGEQEHQWAKKIVDGSGGYAVLAPRTSLTELAALERQARLFVGSDTGPLHLAVAVGTACVELHGPTSVRRCGPYGPQHIAVTGGSLDGARRGRRTDDDLIKAISVERVLAACRTILNRDNRDQVTSQVA